MPIYDTGGFGRNPLKSVADYQGEYLRNDAARGAIQHNQLAMDVQRQAIDKQMRLQSETDAMKNELQAGQIDLNNPAHVNAMASKYTNAFPAFYENIFQS